jgi:hypothetical protein
MDESKAVVGVSIVCCSLSGILRDEATDVEEEEAAIVWAAAAIMSPKFVRPELSS